MADKTRRVDGKPETASDKKFFDLRESGYTGWIDHHGDRVDALPVEHLKNVPPKGDQHV